MRLPLFFHPSCKGWKARLSFVQPLAGSRWYPPTWGSRNQAVGQAACSPLRRDTWRAWWWPQAAKYVQWSSCHCIVIIFGWWFQPTLKYYSTKWSCLGMLQNKQHLQPPTSFGMDFHTITWWNGSSMPVPGNHVQQQYSWSFQVVQKLYSVQSTSCLELEHVFSASTIVYTIFRHLFPLNGSN